MKKLVSLLLAVCMCLSISVMLTACGHEHTYQTVWSKDTTHHWHACEGDKADRGCDDITDKAEHTWNDGEITTPATAESDGVKTFTCTVCGQTKTESVQLKTTVTEAEWKDLFVLTNCTVNGNYVEGFQNETITITAANNQCITTTVESDETFSFYIFLKDGVWYGGETGTRGLICWEMENTTCIILGDVFEAFRDFENKFSEFTYNSEKKAYESGNQSSRSEIYVENGKIAKILYYNEPEEETPSRTFLFGSYGTTVIENFPEFCFEHNFDANWSYDTGNHWKQCTNAGCGKTTGWDAHTNRFNSDPECEICGYVKE